ncbi:MAG: metal-dependent hydrolase [Firmicutes bacterium]|nr:metal-dependent hydrolase [Bacillota bacterium]
MSAGLFLGALAGASLGSGMADVMVSAVIGGATAVLPDVDHPGSMAGRIFRPLSVYLEERWGHRDSPTHTAVFVLLAALPAAAAWVLVGFPPAPGLAALLGGASHLVMDSFTRSGVRPWRYLPVAERQRNKLYRGRLETGKSPLEWGLACAMFVGAVVLSMFKLAKVI